MAAASRAAMLNRTIARCQKYSKSNGVVVVDALNTDLPGTEWLFSAEYRCQVPLFHHDMCPESRRIDRDTYLIYCSGFQGENGASDRVPVKLSRTITRPKRLGMRRHPSQARAQRTFGTVLDAAVDNTSHRLFTDTPVLDRRTVEVMWSLYLGPQWRRGGSPPRYASPAQSPPGAKMGNAVRPDNSFSTMVAVQVTPVRSARTASAASSRLSPDP